MAKSSKLVFELKQNEAFNVRKDGKIVGAVSNRDGMLEGVLLLADGRTFRSPVQADLLESMEAGQEACELYTGHDAYPTLADTGYEYAIEYASGSAAWQEGFRAGLRSCGMHLESEAEMHGNEALRKEVLALRRAVQALSGGRDA